MLRMEEIIAVGNMAYEFVSFIDATWQDHVARGKVLFKEEDDSQIGQLYRKWVEISERRIEEIGRLAREDYEVQVRDRFLSHLEKLGRFSNSALEDHMPRSRRFCRWSKGTRDPSAMASEHPCQDAPCIRSAQVASCGPWRQAVVVRARSDR